MVRNLKPQERLLNSLSHLEDFLVEIQNAIFDVIIPGLIFNIEKVAIYSLPIAAKCTVTLSDVPVYSCPVLFTQTLKSRRHTC